MVVSTAHIFTALLAASSALALPAAEKRQSQCTQPTQRRAWHTLADEEKKAYIDAELCLMGKEATLGLRGAVTKFDELQSVHVAQAELTHSVGAFLPFHRLLMRAHEYLLETECGYTGGQPYWQEQLDAGNFKNSILLDPQTGFGGDGDDRDCVTDGPFANYVNRVGPGYTVQDSCIVRRIDDSQSAMSVQENVDVCLSQPSWATAWPCIENEPHRGGHNGVGGQMSNPISSPGDPLFYLHHTWLDKVWWDWQKQDLPNRLSDMGGRNLQGGNEDGPGPCNGERLFGPLPDDLPAPRIEGDSGCGTTLQHNLVMYGIVADRSIGDMMDIQGEHLCYEYVDPQ
ncbi:hypothetical protein VDGD_07137 [Verticillium dahliae]|nr:hypothetical protein VDGD_07137 [Verticillium dahliae]